jgi:hypothetical protein
MKQTGATVRLCRSRAAVLATSPPLGTQGQVKGAWWKDGRRMHPWTSIDMSGSDDHRCSIFDSDSDYDTKFGDVIRTDSEYTH